MLKFCYYRIAFGNLDAFLGIYCFWLLPAIAILEIFILLKPLFLYFQRAWLLKMLALALHLSDISSPVYREACVAILYHTFGQCADDFRSTSLVHSRDASTGIGNEPANRNKVTYGICIFLIWLFPLVDKSSLDWRTWKSAIHMPDPWLSLLICFYYHHHYSWYLLLLNLLLYLVGCVSCWTSYFHL